MTRYKKCLANQKITLKDTIVDPYIFGKRDDFKLTGFAGILGLGVILGMLVLSGVKKCEMEPQPAIIKRDCGLCHNRTMSMTLYFERAGSKTPEQLAIAVLATKSPRLLAAIHVKGEKLSPYTSRNTGYKKRHSGAWQVSSKDWGTVSKNPTEQALQAEMILIELTNKRPIRQALNIYGGDSTDAYSKRVLAELVKVP